MFLDPKYIVGRIFIVQDPNIEYTCIGYDNNGTPILFGAQYDSTNNRSYIKSFKVSEVKFKQNITGHLPLPT